MLRNNGKNNTSGEQMRGLNREMAEFIALYETIEDKIVAREIALEEKLHKGDKLLSEQLNKIKATFHTFEALMSEAGAARWRIAAENALREGNEHLHVLQRTTHEALHTFQTGTSEFEKIATKSLHDFSEAMNVFQASDIQEAAKLGCKQIKKSSLTGIKRISKLIATFHWKNLSLSILITIFVMLGTSLYVNAEWPWEIHSQAAQERNAGKILLDAWPHLSSIEQQVILNSSKKD